MLQPPLLPFQEVLKVIFILLSVSVLSEGDDMFYSTVDPNHKNQVQGSACDITDTASVSTFAGHSTFTSSNGNVFFLYTAYALPVGGR